LAVINHNNELINMIRWREHRVFTRDPETVYSFKLAFVRLVLLSFGIHSYVCSWESQRGSWARNTLLCWIRSQEKFECKNCTCV